MAIPITESAAVNTAIADAKDLPALVTKLNEIDPAYGQQLTGKALLASKTPWGTLAVGAAAWLSTHYGLGWDEATASLVGGAAVLVGSYAMRALTHTPITSVVTPTPPLPK